jgi:hypothetical protein
MSAETQPKTQEQPQEQEKAQNDKEINFAKVRKQLEEERAARQAAELRASEYERTLQQRQQAKRDLEEEEDDNDEPYVDHKRLDKKLAKFGQKTREETQQEIKKEVNIALAEERKTQWLRNNPDFYDIMNHAQSFADRDPELAESILQMPDTFDRQKLVYRNIKALKLHQKEEPKSSIQDKVDQVKKGAFYQPSGVGTAPYVPMGDCSPAGQKTAYAKMKELQNKLRL